MTQAGNGTPLGVNVEELLRSQPPDEIDIVDFSIDRRPVRFSADGERYECYPVLPLGAIQGIVRIVRDGFKTETEDQIEAAVGKLRQVFAQLMPPEEAARFASRLNADAEKPLDLRRQVLPIMQYILERYGMRPTAPSSSSSASSQDASAGTSSTAGAPSEESTLGI